MAKKSKVIQNQRRIALSAKYRPIRAELRATANNIKLSEEERAQARLKLAKLPRDTSPLRVRNRCALSGRPRGFLAKFSLSRIAFRELALRGLIPGVTKASW